MTSRMVDTSAEGGGSKKGAQSALLAQFSTSGVPLAFTEETPLTQPEGAKDSAPTASVAQFVAGGGW